MNVQSLGLINSYITKIMRKMNENSTVWGYGGPVVQKPAISDEKVLPVPGSPCIVARVCAAAEGSSNGKAFGVRRNDLQSSLVDREGVK